jgi:quinol monooxygenase YgiN
MATLLAHIRVHPGSEAAFERVARALYEASHTHDAGLIRYEYWRGADPATYYTLECFTDYDGFIGHQTSAHHEASTPELRVVLAGLRLEWLDPVDGASPLPATNPTATPPDASQLELDYRRRHAVAVADWWLPLRHG